MLTKFFYYAGVCVVLMMFTASCRQPIDLDTDRTVVPTNLPEITDFSPKAGWMGDRITITGKNFVNVQKVMLDTLTLDSVVVESPTQISAHIPESRPPFIPPSTGLKTINLRTKRGAAASNEKSFAFTLRSIVGRVTSGSQLLDSLVFLVVNTNNATTRIETFAFANFSPTGWYAIGYSTGYTGNLNETENTTIRPFRNGYSFSPRTRSVQTLPGYTPIGGQDFEGKPLADNLLPSVISITPNSGFSYSGSAEIGTTLALRGTNFSTVKKIIVGYPAAQNFSEVLDFTINNDNQITLKLPRFDPTKALSGKTYTNCQIYLLTDEGSLLAPQRISITYI